MKKILVLFPNDWDKVEFASDRYQSKVSFEYFGDDLFKFPHFLKLASFNVHRFIDRVTRKIKSERFDAVLSTDEYIGAIIAAVCARNAGLPGANAAQIILAQHKYHSRLVQQKICPDAAVKCTLIPLSIFKRIDSSFEFPFFVKPVKGTFSLFAKRIDNLAGLKKHMKFNPLERFALNRITKPFNELLNSQTDLKYDANYFIGEEIISGMQVTVDGFVWEKNVTILGVIDSVMFPDTNVFERFEYPSRLPSDVQERMTRIVSEFISGMQYESGQFNVELFYDSASDNIRIIEINSRLSYQFADLYENVDGTNMYDILVDLSLGRRPNFIPGNGRFKFSNSFVLRTFEGKRLMAIPEKGEISKFNQRYKESKIKIYGKRGQRLAGEMRAIGSYRHGIVNIGAKSLLDLFAIYEDALETLTFRFK